MLALHGAASNAAATEKQIEDLGLSGRLDVVHRRLRVEKGLPRGRLLLLGQDVDIRALNKFGCASVQWAAAAGNVQTCKWLLAKGIDFTHINTARHGAIVKAAWKGHRDALEWLLHAADGPKLTAQLDLLDHEGLNAAENWDVFFRFLRNLVCIVLQSELPERSELLQQVCALTVISTYLLAPLRTRYELCQSVAAGFQLFPHFEWAAARHSELRVSNRLRYNSTSVSWAR